jgi:hypothetical protein
MNMIQAMRQISLKQLPKALTLAYVSNQNVFLAGQPGIGKTVTVEKYARMMRKRIPEFQIWRVSMPALTAMDIQATVPDVETMTLTVINTTLLPNALGNDAEAKGSIYLGELAQADPHALKPLQKYINGEPFNGLQKPEGVNVIADGNRQEDKSGAIRQGRAFMSRFLYLETINPVEDDIEYAVTQGFHPDVTSFMSVNPDLVNTYNAEDDNSRADRDIGRWGGMRQWEQLSGLEYAADEFNLALIDMPQMVAAAVGAVIGTKYLAYKTIYKSLPTVAQICANPSTAPVPQEHDKQHALISIILSRITSTQLDSVVPYVMRLPVTLQVLFMRGVEARAARAAKSRRGDGFTISSPAYIKFTSDSKFKSLIRSSVNE